MKKLAALLLTIIPMICIPWIMDRRVILTRKTVICGWQSTKDSLRIWLLHN